MPIDFPVTKYADPSYTDVAPTDDDRVMLRTAAGNDARASIVQPKGYIDGLRMTWVSGTQIQVSAGSAYVPGAKRIAELSAATTLTLSLAANTWYHVYISVSGSLVGVEAVNTAPSAPYYGCSRTKSGDTSRRYIGSFRTLASSAIAKFDHEMGSGNSISYLENINNPPFIVLSAGASVSPASVSAAAVVPPTSKTAKLLANNNATGQFVYLSNSTALNTLSVNAWLSLIFPNNSFYTYLPIDSSQEFNYMYSAAPSGGQAFIRVAGYSYER